jgi:hypothetical protein
MLRRDSSIHKLKKMRSIQFPIEPMIVSLRAISGKALTATVFKSVSVILLFQVRLVVPNFPTFYFVILDSAASN